MKIAIIGCGITGLASIRKAIEYDLECDAFEVNSTIGGVWRYDEGDSDDSRLKNPLPSSCYASLRAHLPTELMEYPKFKFNKSEKGSSFPRHHQILKYLNDFAREYNLLSRIKFNHRVTNVSKRNDKWIVNVKNLRENKTERYEFDGVMVCSGHYWKPSFPRITGIRTFSGHQIHSRFYKHNAAYKDKRVLVVGAGISGLEISMECAQVARKVYLSHEKTLNSNIFDPNLEQKPRTISIKNDQVYFADGSTVTFDAVVYCTGYRYCFPFIDKTCGVEVQDDTIVKPLYKYFINISDPTICFIGLPQHVPIFLQADFQAAIYVKFMTQRLVLPSANEMLASLAEENREKEKENRPKKYYYLLNLKQVRKYLYDLTEMADLEPVRPVLMDVHDKVVGLFTEKFNTIKKYRFEILDDHSFTYYQEET